MSVHGQKEGEGLIHLVAGGLGGTMGSVITCPLEVIKVRLQSSEFSGPLPAASTSAASSSAASATSARAPPQHFRSHQLSPLIHSVRAMASQGKPPSRLLSSAVRGSTPTIATLLRRVVAEEGVRALWKGVVPNILGVAPSKALYFYAYSTFKRLLDPEMGYQHHVGPAGNHMLSAGAAGFIVASVVNPLWLVKTRLQLSHSAETVAGVVGGILREDGVRGLYRGVTASYVGIGETVLQFVLYEALREKYLGMVAEERRSSEAEDQGEELHSRDFVGLMVCAGVAKLCATVSMYPHEVVRTRMREAGNRYTGGFMHTLRAVYAQEGWRALYGGLQVHLVRTLPNTAVVMGTYELVVFLLRRFANGEHR